MLATIQTTAAHLEPAAAHNGSIDLISLIGLILTVVALALAVWQTTIAIKQNRDGRLQSEKLEVVADALSTKYIGPFPDYIAKIAPVIESAQHELRILCTVPMHGVFNNPVGWLRSKQALETFVGIDDPSRKLICVFGSKEERRRRQLYQYRKLKDGWPEWIVDPENAKKMHSLFHRCAPKRDLHDINFDDFISLLETIADREIGTTFVGATIREITFPPPLYLWIADDTQALFVLKTTFPEFRAEAFWTSDRRLVTSLIKIHDNYMDPSEMPLTPEQI